VNDHLARTDQAATAAPMADSRHLRVTWDLPAEPPLVSIVIPTRDQYEALRTCTDGLFNRTDYDPMEVVILDNASRDPAMLALLAEFGTRDNVTIIRDDGPF